MLWLRERWFNRKERDEADPPAAPGYGGMSNLLRTEETAVPVQRMRTNLYCGNNDGQKTVPHLE